MILKGKSLQKFLKLIKAQPKDQRESEAYEIFLKFTAFIDGKLNIM